MATSTSDKITVDSLGYHFCKQRIGEQDFTVLRDKTTNEKFKFDVYGDESKNQQRYEELGEAVKNYVQDDCLAGYLKLSKIEIPAVQNYVQDDCLAGYSKLSKIEIPAVQNYVQDDCLAGYLKLSKIEIPVGAKTGEPEGFFFMSEHAENFKKLIILVHGGGAVRAGQWARSLIINENLECGTMVPYIEKALEEGYGVIVTNGNHNKDSNNRPIKGSESAQDHFVYVWNNFIRKAKAEHIVIVAHSLGGKVVLHGLKEIDEAMRRIKAVAFTHSTHTTANESLKIKKWLKERARDWVCSDKPLDSPVNMNREDDCDQVSAETMKHTLTSHLAKDSVFKYFQQKLNGEGSSFIKPTRFSLMASDDRPFNETSVYKMTSSPRGLAVIVNVKHFPRDSHREGLEVDVKGLKELFEGLDFQIKMLIDKTKVELLSEFQSILQSNDILNDCLVVCIMSHGDEDSFLACDGKAIKIRTIQEMFNNKNCQSLCGKPKLFFVCACRGDAEDGGVLVREGGSDGSNPSRLSPSPNPNAKRRRQGISENADVLTAFSTVVGYVSYRDQAKGTWFISSLIEVFGEFAGKEDVLRMLTRVNDKVSSKGDEVSKKQVSKPENTLRKAVYFWPGMKF